MTDLPGSTVGPSNRAVAANADCLHTCSHLRRLEPGLVSLSLLRTCECTEHFMVAARCSSASVGAS